MRLVQRQCAKDTCYFIINNECWQGGFISRHIQRMNEEDPVRRAWKEAVRRRRSVGRQRVRWKDVVERDMREKGLRVENARDRVYRRQHVRAAYP